MERGQLAATAVAGNAQPSKVQTLEQRAVRILVVAAQLLRQAIQEPELAHANRSQMLHIALQSSNACLGGQESSVGGRDPTSVLSSIILSSGRSYCITAYPQLARKCAYAV